MKNVINVLVIFILAFSMSSCAIIKKDIELSQEQASVQSIEIYNSDHAYYEGDIHLFREENEPFVILAAKDHSDFLDAIQKLKFEEEKVFFPIPMDGGYDYEGYIVTIVYEDGGYDIIAENGLYSYAVGKGGQGRHKYDHSDYCGKEAWADFVEKYIVK